MSLIKKYLKKEYLGGSFLIAAAMIANVLNFAFNAYLGRALDLKEFGLISLFGSFYTFASIGFSAFGTVINYKAGFLIGRYGIKTSEVFLAYMQKISLKVAIFASVVWISLIPLLANYFHTENYGLFLFFAPVWILGFIAAINRGYISARLKFMLLGVIIIVEPLLKLFSSFVFLGINHSEYVYLSIPLSTLGVLSISQYILSKKSKAVLTGKKLKQAHSFPMKYLLTSTISGLSTISFLSVDVVLARHFLSPEQAGQYALISLIGKMVYFMSGLSSQFVVPLISHYEGAKKDSKKLFYKLLGATVVLTLAAFIPLGALSGYFAPLLFGEKVYPVLQYLPIFLFAMMAFSISRIFVGYYQVKREYVFSVVAFLLSFVQVGLIQLMHNGIGEIVNAMVIVSLLNLLVMVVMHLNYRLVKIIEFNFNDFVSLFRKSNFPTSSRQGLNILIFNWRDTKHTWAGGAEAYIHELGKRWVESGNNVTLFCGNDYDSKKDEVVDGITIMRRGGFYTMYVWAAIYYVIKLRGKFDIIIDSENGIPFFTPLFARKPIFLLIHHVHQEVFMAHLKFPFAQLASFIEGKLMPFVYKNKKVITVSESSKKEIVKLGFSKDNEIGIVNPGIDLRKYTKMKKAKNPSFVYVGRLKPYKNIEVAIKAFSKILELYPDAKLDIAGEGESMKHLVSLKNKLNLKSSVRFHGRVSQTKKAVLLAKAWAAVQPSMIEGWGITVIEANASGTPVIASNVNGLRDSIVDKKTGLLVNPRSVSEFADAMKRIAISKSFRDKISKNAFQWSKNFDWSQSSDRFYSIVTNALTQKTRKIMSGVAALRKFDYEK